MYNNVYSNPISVPFHSQGLVIPVSAGSYNIPGGYTAELWVSLEVPGGQQPVYVKLSLTFTPGTPNAQYTTVNNEWPSVGVYDAMLKVYNGAGILVYSLIYNKAIWVYPVFG